MPDQSCGQAEMPYRGYSMALRKIGLVAARPSKGPSAAKDVQPVERVQHLLRYRFPTHTRFHTLLKRCISNEPAFGGAINEEPFKR